MIKIINIGLIGIISLGIWGCSYKEKVSIIGEYKCSSAGVKSKVNKYINFNLDGSYETNLFYKGQLGDGKRYKDGEDSILIYKQSESTSRFQKLDGNSVLRLMENDGSNVYTICEKVEK